MTRMVWPLALTLAVGCLGNGMGANEVQLTDAEVHQLVEEWFDENESGERAPCEWAAEPSQATGRHNCVRPGGVEWRALYRPTDGTGGRASFTISSRYLSYQCRINGRTGNALGRLGCWITAIH
jgi:hypothetical protein